MRNKILKVKTQANHLTVELRNREIKDFPGGPVAKTMHSIPGQGTDPTRHNYRPCVPLLLLLLLSRFSRVRLCATPWTAAHQASPSMGFSRQEHWSGLPFPSPMHESEE